MKILELALKTSVLDKMKEFYTVTMEFPLITEGADTFVVLAGETKLTFTLAEKGEPHYHFAFNISEKKMSEAVDWLAQRVNIIPYENEKIIHFESWNAHAAYFEDPAGNIVEFIARHNLPDQTQTGFSSKDILCVSEIGVPVHDVLKSVAVFQSAIGVPPWKKPTDTFSTLGDENGLFIVVNTGRQWFMSEKISKHHPMNITISGPELNVFHYEGYTFKSTIG